MCFSLLKRVVTYHVKVLGEFGCILHTAQQGGWCNALPLKMCFGKTVECNVCYEQIAANVEGKHGHEKAL